jgi:hypothetical protein
LLGDGSEKFVQSFVVKRHGRCRRGQRSVVEKKENTAFHASVVRTEL